MSNETKNVKPMNLNTVNDDDEIPSSLSKPPLRRHTGMCKNTENMQTPCTQNISEQKEKRVCKNVKM